MLTKRILLFFTPLAAFLWFATGCNSAPQDRQEQVAEAGMQVMPFDLERTTHIFEKLENGGLQQVVSDDGDAEQIALIRMHLSTRSRTLQTR